MTLISPGNPPDPPDPVLWASALAGDEHDFGRLFDRYARTIYNYCFRRTADWSVAEDLTSVVFLETWRRRGKVELKSGSLLPWLYGVATNVLRNHRRSLRRHRDALARVPATPTAADEADGVTARLDAEHRMREVMAVIRSLPLHDQEVLALCVWEGLGYADAATALGVSVGTVRSRLNRARERLRAVGPGGLGAPDPGLAGHSGHRTAGHHRPLLEERKA